MEKKRPIVYVTRDIERALGMEPSVDYMVISNDTPYGKEVQKKHPEHIVLVTGETLDTFDLLSLPRVATFIREKNARVMVFQNNPRIERLAHERDWTLLNPSADLARRVEEKVSQVEWLGRDASLLPPHRIVSVKDARFEDKRFVLQFNHTHTGEGTYIIDSQKALTDLQSRFPDRPCRIVDFIDGPIFTLNVVVSTFILCGSISYQITGLKPFTDLPFSTIGNDWSLASELSTRDKKKIKNIARVVGRRLRKNGWKGLFGIDVVKDEKTGKIYLLEINARQPASATYESELERIQGINTNSPTIFEAHVAALAGRGWNIKDRIAWRLRGIDAGAQIVQRVTHTPAHVDVPKLRAQGFTVIPYQNTEHNKELYRLQSRAGIMKAHGILKQ